MKYVAAYLLAEMGGDASPDNITAILTKAGIDCDQARLDALISSIGTESTQALIEKGRASLASVPSGTSAPQKAAGQTVTEHVEEEVAQKEESDDDMGFGLFD